MGQFSLKPDVLTLILGWNLNISLGEDRDDVLWQQGNVVSGIVIDSLLKIEGQETGGKRILVQALDDRVLPVDLRGDTRDLVAKAILPLGAGLGGCIQAEPVVAGEEHV